MLVLMYGNGGLKFSQSYLNQFLESGLVVEKWHLDGVRCSLSQIMKQIVWGDSCSFPKKIISTGAVLSTGDAFKIWVAPLQEPRTELDTTTCTWFGIQWSINTKKIEL